MAAVALCDRQPLGHAAPITGRRVAGITSLEAPLIRRAQAGDSGAVGELYGRHERRVRRYVASQLRGGHAADIDDLVAETFVTAIERIWTFDLDRPGEFGNWLIGIARNKLLGWLNRPSRRETAVDDVSSAAVRTEAASASPEELVLDRMEIADALSRLAPTARRALVLQHAVGLPTAEIALALGTTKRSIWALTGLARLELRGEAGVCVCGCGAAVRPTCQYATRACQGRVAAMRRVFCACGCGVDLPAVRRHNRRYATARCRNRAAWQRHKEAQRRYLAGPVTADPAVERVLALVQAAGEGTDRRELSRRTRLLVSRLDRALDLLARRGLISVVLEPGDGRLAVRYRALAGATATATAWRAA